jgi:hypothetical protein
MPVSKPNKRWSRRRRWQERRAVAKPMRAPGGDPAGGIVHTGASVFDPMTNYQKLGRFQGTMLRAAFQDIGHARDLPSVLGWSMLGILLAGMGLVFAYEIVVDLHATGPFVWVFGTVFPVSGFLILKAQLANLTRLAARRRGHRT